MLNLTQGGPGPAYTLPIRRSSLPTDALLFLILSSCSETCSLRPPSIVSVVDPKGYVCSLSQSKDGLGVGLCEGVIKVISQVPKISMVTFNPA